MHPFEYEAPESLQDAIQLLGDQSGKAKFLAGGTDLIDQMRNKRHQPELVIDVKRIPELSQLKSDHGHFMLGAATSCSQILRSQEVMEKLTALHDCAHIIGGIQIQSRASVGGNLCNSSPAADSIPALMVLKASCLIAGPNGQRELPVGEFCTGPGKNVLEQNELLIAIKIPLPEGNSGSHYRRIIPRNEMDIAIAGCASFVELAADGKRITSASIALGAVAPKPCFAKAAAESLIDRPLDGELLIEAGELAKEVCQPIDDMRGTAAYRVEMASVLVRRTVAFAIERAQGKDVQYHPGRS